ncbi:MAG: PilZ domain-containing protein [bacterium]|nr:PilZ domain-containing protein [bacterium]
MIKLIFLKDYLKKYADSKGVRRYLRIPTRIPVLYAFPEKGKRVPLDYRQCYTSDISQGGLAVKVIDLPSSVLKKFLQENKDIFVKLDIPGRKGLMELTGKIQWYETLQERAPSRHLIGIRFDMIDPDDRIDLLSYAVRMTNRKKMIRITLTLLILAFLGSGIWGVQTYLLKKEVKKKLVISEKARQKLSLEIRDLDKKRSELTDQLEYNLTKLGEQDRLLKKQQKIIKEMSLYLNGSKLLLEDIYKEWNIDTLSDFIVFDDLYRSGQQALKNKEYDQAVRNLQALVKKYPDSLLGYRLLVSALYWSGKKDEADKAFNEYTDKLKAQVIQPGTGPKE